MFKSNTAIRNINKIKENYNNIDIFHNNLDSFIILLNNRITKYKIFNFTNIFLRICQTLSAFGISILTTTNNPYINDYQEDINNYPLLLVE